MTGAELNAEKGTEYDPTALFNVFNTGEIKEVRQGPLVEMTGEKASEKGMAEFYVKRYGEIVSEGNAGYSLKSTNAMLANLMQDPDFTSGAFTDTKMNLQKLVNRSVYMYNTNESFKDELNNTALLHL